VPGCCLDHSEMFAWSPCSPWSGWRGHDAYIYHRGGNGPGAAGRMGGSGAVCNLRGRLVPALKSPPRTIEMLGCLCHIVRRTRSTGRRRRYNPKPTAVPERLRRSRLPAPPRSRLRRGTPPWIAFRRCNSHSRRRLLGVSRSAPRCDRSPTVSGVGTDALHRASGAAGSSDHGRDGCVRPRCSMVSANGLVII
jgi:hypothetical protein